MVFMDATLSLRLKSLGVREYYIGYIFALPALLYAIAAIICGALAQKFNRPILIFIFFMFSVPILWLVGPSTMIGLP